MPSSNPNRARRRGLSVLEVTLALMILTVAIAGLVQLLTTAAAQRRTSETRRHAAQEVANQAERIALWSWDELTTEKLANMKPSADLTAVVPTATAAAALTAEAGPPESKRVELIVAWTDASGQSLQPVRLTVWKHRLPETTP